MPDIEAPEPDAAEQEQTASGTPAPPSVPSIDAETPEGDALEQANTLGGGSSATRTGDRPLEANEADVQEQQSEQPVEDDYDR